MELSQQIRLARERSGKTVEEVASALGCSPQAVKYWEAGATEPRIKSLRELEKLLGVHFNITGTADDGTLPVLNDLSAEAIEIARRIDTMPKVIRHAIFTQVEYMSCYGNDRKATGSAAFLELYPPPPPRGDERHSTGRE